MDLEEMRRFLREMPCQMERNYAFVSYSHFDRERVWLETSRWMCQGYNIYLDTDFERHGSSSNWVDQIRDVIGRKNCRLVICFRSLCQSFSYASLLELLTIYSDSTFRMHQGEPVCVDVILLEDVPRRLDRIPESLRETCQASFRKMQAEMGRTFAGSNQPERNRLLSGLREWLEKMERSARESFGYGNCSAEDLLEDIDRAYSFGYEDFYLYIYGLISNWFCSHNLNGNFLSLNSDIQQRFAQVKVERVRDPLPEEELSMESVFGVGLMTEWNRPRQDAERTDGPKADTAAAGSASEEPLSVGQAAGIGVASSSSLEGLESEDTSPLRMLTGLEADQPPAPDLAPAPDLGVRLADGFPDGEASLWMEPEPAASFQPVSSDPSDPLAGVEPLLSPECSPARPMEPASGGVSVERDGRPSGTEVSASWSVERDGGPSGTGTPVGLSEETPGAATGKPGAEEPSGVDGPDSPEKEAASPPDEAFQQDPMHLDVVGGVLKACRSSVEALEIGAGVREIGKNAFRGITSLRAVRLPEGVERIGASAFDGCSNLACIRLPSTLRSIDSCAFQNCNALTSVSLPDGLERIGSGSFYQCRSLESVVLPAGLETIPDHAFFGSGARSVRIGEGVVSIRASAFSECRKLEEILLPDSLRTIEGYAFLDCRSLKGIRLPQGATTIGQHAFNGCWSLERAVLPSSVTGIGGNAFSQCGLVEVVLPASMAEIRIGTFSGCGKLERVLLPENLKTIGLDAFAGCSSLRTIRIPKSVTRILRSAFRDCPSLRVEAYRGSPGARIGLSWNVTWVIVDS